MEPVGEQLAQLNTVQEPTTGPSQIVLDMPTVNNTQLTLLANQQEQRLVQPQAERPEVRLAAQLPTLTHIASITRVTSIRTGW